MAPMRLLVPAPRACWAVTSSPPPRTPGTTSSPWPARDLDITDAVAVRAAVGRPPRRRRQLRRLDRRRRRRGRTRPTRPAINGDGAGHARRRRARRRARLLRLRLRRRAPDPYAEAAPTGPVSAYGRSKLAGEVAVATGRRRLRDRPLRLALRPARRELRGHDAAARRRARRGRRGRRPGRLPDLTGHLAPALVDHRRAPRSPAWTRRGWRPPAPGTSSRRRRSRRRRRRAVAAARPRPRSPRPAPRPAFSGSSSNATTCSGSRPGGMGSRAYLAIAG